MCWLPLSITAAQAMSAQMMLNHFNSKTQQLVTTAKEMTSESMPCHQYMQTSKGEKALASVCVKCAACDLATAFATFDVPSSKPLPKKIADKFIITQSSLISVQLPPSIKPPRLY